MSETTAKLREKIRALESELAQLQRVDAERTASEERFRILFEQAPDGCYLNDLKGTFIDGNRAAEDLIGYRREEMVGKSFLELPVLSPGQIPRAAMLLARNAMGQSTGPDEFVLTRKDGQKVVVEISTHVVEVEGRSLVLGIARDISERKRESDALRRNRDELEQLVAQRTGDLERANEDLREEIRVREQSSQKERIIHGVRQQVWSMRSPDDIGRVLKAVRASLEELKIPFVACSMNLISMNENSPQVRFHNMGHADEDWVVADDSKADELIGEFWRRGEICYRRDLLEDDRYGEGPGIKQAYGRDIRSLIDIPFSHGTLGVNSDVPDAFTEEHIGLLKQMVGVLEEGFHRVDDLERLARSREQFRTLVETPEMGVALMKPDGGYLYINPYLSERTGYSADDFFVNPALGRELVHPDDIGELEEMLAAVSRGESRTGVEFRWRARGRTDYTWAVETVYPIRDHRGEIYALQALIVDIDGRKQVEREMIRLEKLRALGEMAAGVSHNLNNMLTGILGPAESLAEEAEDLGVRAEARAILVAAERAADLVKRLHRSVAPQDDEGLSDIPLQQAVDEAVRAARPRWRDEAAAKGVQIEVRSELPALPPVRGSAALVQDILINLLFNAIDAMPQGGAITFTGAVEGEVVILEVSDTGIGMDAEVQRRVFEPFFTTKNDVGTGLGLATVFNTMKNWQGSVAVESEPGRGTRFILRFPRGSGIAEVATDTPAPGTITAERPLRMLVVEDDEQVARFLAKVLSGMGVVEICHLGREALARFDEMACDVAILDLGLPDIAGDEIARKLRRRDPCVGLVLVSGWRLAESDPRREPFDLYMPKPFSGLQEIRGAIVRALELRDEREAQLKPVLR